MINNKFKNGIEDLKMISMTSDEKKQILQNILKDSSLSLKPENNTFGINSLLSTFSINRRLVYYAVVPLIIILSGTSIVFASENILPDSVLYPIKVNIVEPIEGAISFSQKSKARHESNLAEKRIVEAERLASEGKLDINTENKINKLISKHTIALNKAIDKINISDKNQDVEEITTNFQAEMNAHAVILDNIKHIKDIKRNGSDLNYKSNINDSQRNTSTENSDNTVSSTARFNANKIKDLINIKENGNLDKYNKRKNRVEDLINKTVNDVKLESLKNNRNSNSVYDTNRVLVDAKNYLNDADQMKDKGNQKEAYQSMLDSESKIIEANIILRSNLKSDHRDNRGDKNN